MQVQKFGGPPLHNFGAKNMQNLAQFYTTSDFDREYLRRSPERDKTSKMGKMCDRERFLPRSAKQVLWTLVHKVVHVSLDPPKWTFSGDYISAPRRCWSLKFLDTLEIDQVLRAHTTNRVG